MKDLSEWQKERDEFNRSQVEWYKKQIAYNDREIAWLTEQLAESRADDKHMAEYVWSKGVLTRTEMEIWGNPKKFESTQTHQYKLQRRREYLRRKHNMKMLAEYEAKIA